MRSRIRAELGAVPAVAGQDVPAFPRPERLLAAETLPGMAASRVGWLRTVARAAPDGQLSPSRLAAMEPGEALADPQKLPGIGPLHATLVLLRAAGVTDVLTSTEPRRRRLASGMIAAHTLRPLIAVEPTAS
ncbi:MAG TPA: hypothetical protein VHF26_22325 [Trebonia sp.]|nr:hypothetical protein [Trebonia sp.]